MPARSDLAICPHDRGFPKQVNCVVRFLPQLAASEMKLAARYESVQMGNRVETYEPNRKRLKSFFGRANPATNPGRKWGQERRIEAKTGIRAEEAPGLYPRGIPWCRGRGLNPHGRVPRGF